ncbi:hypothetical protein LX32DRAFT_697336 [Colletotrichum zoysiae]|uniref:Uncharacterized protein n=1 Tax=Colletotrichum zoysiae TaxID=1216348 RepID=A0AAD9LX96_9PEZI|nr:hypothetical protein LX32DRAFT_697336 [Colletotrichum zoysiae]
MFATGSTAADNCRRGATVAAACFATVDARQADGSPIIEDTRKQDSLQPLTHTALTSEHSTSVPTPTGDGAPSEPSTIVRSDVLSIQEPETSHDYDHGDVLSEMPPSLTRDRASYSEAKPQYAREAIGDQSGFTRTKTAADSHRKSKTEFNSIPDGVVPVGLDMTRCTDTDSQAHRKSSTEFAKITDAIQVKQPQVQGQATAMPPMAPKPRSAPGGRQDNGGRDADSQLW